MIQFNRRKMERFDLELPIYLRIFDTDKKRESLNFTTSNICSGGAFFRTEKPLSVGTDVKLDIILPLNKFKNIKSKISHIDVSGSVIRTDQQGMAICFDKNYKISSY
jgi:c-di-GMP-binding flagellar brake protein YcgR